MNDYQEIWCQPRQSLKRQFVVFFDDPDQGIAVFDDEDEARTFWEKANMAWSCYLLGTLPREKGESIELLKSQREQLRKALADMLPPKLTWKERDADGFLVHHQVSAINAARSALAATETKGQSNG